MAALLFDITERCLAFPEPFIYMLRKRAFTPADKSGSAPLRQLYPSSSSSASTSDGTTSWHSSISSLPHGPLENVE